MSKKRKKKSQKTRSKETKKTIRAISAKETEIIHNYKQRIIFSICLLIPIIYFTLYYLELLIRYYLPNFSFIQTAQSIITAAYSLPNPLYNILSVLLGLFGSLILLMRTAMGDHKLLSLETRLKYNVKQSALKFYYFTSLSLFRLAFLVVIFSFVLAHIDWLRYEKTGYNLMYEFYMRLYPDATVKDPNMVDTWFFYNFICKSAVFAGLAFIFNVITNKGDIVIVHIFFKGSRTLRVMIGPIAFFLYLFTTCILGLFYFCMTPILASIHFQKSYFPNSKYYYWILGAIFLVLSASLLIFVNVRELIRK